MAEDKKMKKLYTIIFIMLIAAFVYFRLIPILNHTVPYTYDQGRDFLKAMEMVENRRPTFIGPTTGIMGVFHGAWWYYVLLVPNLLFKGEPIGFYYFMFALSIIGNIGFFVFLKKKFSYLTALLFLAAVSVSPYFIPLGFTASNNIIVPYLLMALIAVTITLFEKEKKPYIYFLLGLTLTFILEFEVAFGLFIIPTYLFTVLLFKELRQGIFKLKHFMLLGLGLAIPLLPRMLFEIKNNFLQTKTVLGFLSQPKLHNPKPLHLVFIDRINLFLDYIKGIVYDHSTFIALVLVVFTIGALILYRKNNRLKSVTVFLSTLVILLFGVSLFYKDNFWFNYYEGIQYVFLTLFLIAFSLLTKRKPYIQYAIVGFFVAINIFAVFKDISSDKNTQLIGLAEAEAAFDYIHGETGKNDYCLRIYTPPVIPHTYVYLMNHRAKTQDYKISTYNFRDDECYFIVESEPYVFRIEKWREDNTPLEAVIKNKEVLTDNVTVEKWVLK